MCHLTRQVNEETGCGKEVAVVLAAHLFYKLKAAPCNKACQSIVLDMQQFSWQKAEKRDADLTAS